MSYDSHLPDMWPDRVKNHRKIEPTSSGVLEMWFVQKLKLIRPCKNTPIYPSNHSKHFGNHIATFKPSWYYISISDLSVLIQQTPSLNLTLRFMSLFHFLHLYMQSCKMINIDQSQWPLRRSAVSFMEMKLQLLEKSILPPAPHLQTERCYSCWNWLSIASLSRQVIVKMIEDCQRLQATEEQTHLHRCLRLHAIHHGRFWCMEVHVSPLPYKQNG